ncbi:MAG: hypothetical protein NZ957_03630 [Thaumarchaeota archaeon]|nr:hypothetical protein [Candidatus Calditenuaceae archaeon]MDW8042452.1 hypothetical protein [Nitrososphaerota archaeon]
MSRYRVYLFVQGRGWVPSYEVTDLPRCFPDRESALDHAASFIASAASSASWPYGSRAGDAVAFKVTEEDGACEGRVPRAPRTFSELRYRFFRRGEVYALYKSWSWPD